MNIAIIGGGAAGFFAAISCKKHHPKASVTIFEKSDKLLAKVRISGGGRCNVTHACFNNSQLSKYYPRGEKQLKKAFSYFNAENTVEWFENKGVKLKAEEDGRMFPITDDSQTIVSCLMNEVNKLGVIIKQSFAIVGIEKLENNFELLLQNDRKIKVDKVIVTTGGNSKSEAYDWLRKLNHIIEKPVPSLFTFNMPNESIKQLMGVVVESASVKIVGTKLINQGPLLITHWGMSGPAILKLSAWGARYLNELNYNYLISINWTGNLNEEQVRELLHKQTQIHGKRKLANDCPFKLPSRLWLFLLQKLEISSDLVWAELDKKSKNRLLNALINDEYQVNGKTTFKEEFVTCGGISLEDVSMESMQSKRCKGLYFAGEVLDIDGVTGGFNFQAAWTTGFIAGKLLD